VAATVREATFPTREVGLGTLAAGSAYLLVATYVSQAAVAATAPPAGSIEPVGSSPALALAMLVGSAVLVPVVTVTFARRERLSDLLVFEEYRPVPTDRRYARLAAAVLLVNLVAVLANRGLSALNAALYPPPDLVTPAAGPLMPVLTAVRAAVTFWSLIAVYHVVGHDWGRIRAHRRPGGESETGDAPADGRATGSRTTRPGRVDSASSRVRRGPRARPDRPRDARRAAEPPPTPWERPLGVRTPTSGPTTARRRQRTPVGGSERP
jgi:hypothetical protein